MKKYVNYEDALRQMQNSKIDKPPYGDWDIAHDCCIDIVKNLDTIQSEPTNLYYVIRNTETGLYFRGKGVNRWGKHFNQASIYRIRGSAENSVKEISYRKEKAEIVPIQIIEQRLD